MLYRDHNISYIMHSLLIAADHDIVRTHGCNVVPSTRYITLSSRNKTQKQMELLSHNADNIAMIFGVDSAHCMCGN